MTGKENWVNLKQLSHISHTRDKHDKQIKERRDREEYQFQQSLMIVIWSSHDNNYQ